VTEDWPELAELIARIEEGAAEGWQRASQVRAQAAGLAPHVVGLAQQFVDLGVDVHLRQLNERLLGGLGSVELVEGGMGVERIAALVWPADIHPQPASSEAEQGEGLYRIEVWLGPGLQDGRARIRIAGAKRLEAVLPTSAERFRAALLSVFQSPMFVQRPPAEETDGDEVSTDEDAAT